MRVEKLADYTAIFLDKSEAMKLCRPGAGADTCIWLVCGTKGFECFYYNRRVFNILGETLEDRWKRGDTNAKRDGCEEIRKLKIDIIEPGGQG